MDDDDDDDEDDYHVFIINHASNADPLSALTAVLIQFRLSGDFNRPTFSIPMFLIFPIKQCFFYHNTYKCVLYANQSLEIPLSLILHTRHIPLLICGN